MKRDFDFEEVGKKIPYQIPEAFFDHMQKNVMTCVSEGKSRKSLVLRMLPVFSAVAAVFVAVLFLPRYFETVEKEVSLTQVTAVDDTWIESISDEDLEMMSDFTDYDLFMNE